MVPLEHENPGQKENESKKNSNGCICSCTRMTYMDFMWKKTFIYELEGYGWKPLKDLTFNLGGSLFLAYLIC